MTVSIIKKNQEVKQEARKPSLCRWCCCIVHWSCVVVFVYVVLFWLVSCCSPCCFYGVAFVCYVVLDWQFSCLVFLFCFVSCFAVGMVSFAFCSLPCFVFFDTAVGFFCVWVCLWCCCVVGSKQSSAVRISPGWVSKQAGNGIHKLVGWKWLTSLPVYLITFSDQSDISQLEPVGGASCHCYITEPWQEVERRWFL